jgi:hypothetical protein
MAVGCQQEHCSRNADVCTSSPKLEALRVLLECRLLLITHAGSRWNSSGLAGSDEMATRAAMKRKESWSAIPVAVLLAGLGSLVWSSHTEAQLQITFGGDATAAVVRVAGTALALADTGPLPTAGGGLGAALLSGNVPSGLTAGVVALTAGTLHAAITGLDRTRAEASVAGINVSVSGNGIAAGFLMARSEASCAAGPAVTGSSQLAGLVINGQPINITGAANQTVPLPNGLAIINEQLPSVTSSSGQLAVNALHVTTRDVLTGQPLADVTLASANAQVQCQGGFALNFPRLDLVDVVFAQTRSGQFTSGGGWVLGNFGDKATFGFVAGTQTDGTVTGHVVFIDHSANFSIESTAITNVDTSVPCQATIMGNATSNGNPVHFTVTVQDNGEPGTRDTFHIEVEDGTAYTNSSNMLGGGNIEADGTWAGGRALRQGQGCS